MLASFDGGLSTVFGTETLAERDMVPEGFENAPSSFPCPQWLLSMSGALLAQKLITPERNALTDATIETAECLKAWWDQRPTKQGLAPLGLCCTACWEHWAARQPIVTFPVMANYGSIDRVSYVTRGPISRILE
jgi:hypothetical protein